MCLRVRYAALSLILVALARARVSQSLFWVAPKLRPIAATNYSMKRNLLKTPEVVSSRLPLLVVGGSRLRLGGLGRALLGVRRAVPLTLPARWRGRLEPGGRLIAHTWYGPG